MNGRLERVLRACAVAGCLVAMLVPWMAQAGNRSMIPPGREALVRQLVDAAFDEGPVDVHIERDRIRLTVRSGLGDGLGSSQQPTLRVVIFHPEAVPADLADALAPGILLECGPSEEGRRCRPDELERWRELGRRLAAARDPLVDRIWQIEESGVQARGSEGEDPSQTDPAARWLDRGAAIVALLMGLGLAVFGLRRQPEAARIGRGQLALLAALISLLILATLSQTRLLPLHEHNSFLARSDCAIDERCARDPAGAWSMTTMHAYGLVLSLLPYRVTALSATSLAISAVVVVLVWAVARATLIALGRPELGGVAGLVAAAMLVSQPAFWRLSGSASFWPWAIAWALGGALAGLWAARACADPSPRMRRAGALAWLVAAICLAFVCGGNLVCLTLGVLLGLAPLCWTRAWDQPELRRLARRRALALGPAAIAAFAWLTLPDYRSGSITAFVDAGVGEELSVTRLLGSLDLVAFDPRVSPIVWAPVLLAALGWLGRERAQRRRALRTLLPLLVAWLVPTLFLGQAAGELVGSGYPVGFINHHWELCWSAVGVGLGAAWLVGVLERRRPLAKERSWRVILPAALTAVALLSWPLCREAWRLATGERVLERELVALERAFARLPEHDLLVVAPQTLEPLTDAPSRWDPLEVVFPVGAYEHAMRERGLEPALVVGMDQIPELRPGERALLYLGSSLRSFQPHEIEAGVVPEGLERPELVELRDRFETSAVLEFPVRTEQHEAISQRLGADRVGELELGFYWLEPRPR